MGIDDNEMCFVLLFISLEAMFTSLCELYNKRKYLLYCANVKCVQKAKMNPK